MDDFRIIEVNKRRQIQKYPCTAKG